MKEISHKEAFDLLLDDLAPAFKWIGDTAVKIHDTVKDFILPKKHPVPKVEFDPLTKAHTPLSEDERTIMFDEDYQVQKDTLKDGLAIGVGAIFDMVNEQLERRDILYTARTNPPTAPGNLLIHNKYWQLHDKYRGNERMIMHKLKWWTKKNRKTILNTFVPLGTVSKADEFTSMTKRLISKVFNKIEKPTKSDISKERADYKTAGSAIYHHLLRKRIEYFEEDYNLTREEAEKQLIDVMEKDPNFVESLLMKASDIAWLRSDQRRIKKEQENKDK